MIDYWKKKISGYQRYWRHEQSMRKYRRREEQSQRLYHRWLSDIKQRKPDVFLTANQQFGGVRNHLLAIERYSGLNIEVVPNERSFPDFKLLTEPVRELMIQQIPDCLAMHSHVLPWAIQWGRNAQQKGVRWVHTYHLNYFPEHGTAGLKPWQIEVNDALLNVAPHADIRLSVARWQQKDLATQHGIQSYYLPNGVDVQSCDQADAKRFIKKSGQRDFVIYVGRHDPVKNPGEFVQLAQAMPNQQFVMVGQNIDAETLRREYGQEPPANLYIHGPEDHAGVQVVGPLKLIQL